MASEQKSTATTPTGKPRRTRAEISAEAERKRLQKAAKRTARAEKKRVEAEAKAERRAIASARRKAALAKQIAADKRRRERRDPSRQTISLLPETPHHVFAERLQDDPEKCNWNHVVDPSWEDEDAFVALLDARRTTVIVEKEIETMEDGWDLEDEAVETDDTGDDITDILAPPKRPFGNPKIGGGYCKSDYRSGGRHEIEARRGNGWKVHRRRAQYAS